MMSYTNSKTIPANELRVKAISKNEYTQIAEDFCSFSRRKNRRIASYVTIFTTQTMSMDGQGSREVGRRKRQMDKKTSELGIFFAGNRLSKLFCNADHIRIVKGGKRQMDKKIDAPGLFFVGNRLLTAPAGLFGPGFVDQPR